MTQVNGSESTALEHYEPIAKRLVDLQVPWSQRHAIVEAADAIRYLAVRLDAAEAELERWSKGRVGRWTVHS